MSYIGNEPIVSATRTVTEVSATAGQTVFTANGGYTVGFIDVFVNGSKLTNSDFTATNGTTITLNEAAQASDIVRLEALGTFNTNSVQGNLELTGTAARIRGDFSNATHANRVAFQTSTANGATTPFFIPNGTGNIAGVVVANASDPTNSSFGQLRVNGTSSVDVISSILGTGTQLPMTFSVGGERMRIDTSGNVGIGTSSPGARFAVETTGNTEVRISTAANSPGQTNTLRFSSSASGGSWAGGGAYIQSIQGGGVDAYSLAFGTANVSTTATEQARITSTGLFQFNSGYGSVATAYGCRAWVRKNSGFDGLGNGIMGSGGVSSLTQLSTGRWAVNLSFTLPDTNYSVIATGFRNNSDAILSEDYSSRSTSSFTVRLYNYQAAAYDFGFSAAIIR